MTKRINVRQFAGAPATAPATAHSGPTKPSGGPSAYAGDTLDHLRKHRRERSGRRSPSVVAAVTHRWSPRREMGRSRADPRRPE